MERYNTIAEDAESAVATSAHPSVGKSPLLPASVPGSVPLMAASPPAVNHRSHISLPSAAIAGAGQLPQVDTSGSGLMSMTTSPGLQAEMFQSPAIASPLVASTDPIRDAHLWGQEPRYFPGVVTRSQRKNSTRQSSMHESDKA